jgi:hypothetical protein
MATGGMATLGAAAARAEAARLPWPVAALTIGSLSLGLWLGIGWLVLHLL